MRRSSWRPQGSLGGGALDLSSTCHYRSLGHTHSHVGGFHVAKPRTSRGPGDLEFGHGRSPPLTVCPRLPSFFSKYALHTPAVSAFLSALPACLPACIAACLEPKTLLSSCVSGRASPTHIRTQDMLLRAAHHLGTHAGVITPWRRGMGESSLHIPYMCTQPYRSTARDGAEYLCAYGR